MSPRPSVTVVMRTKDSAWSVEQALVGLFSQRGVSFELLIVDSGSRDHTLEIVDRFPHRRIDIERTSYLPGRVLNSAVAQCATRWVAFQNSDVIPLGDDVLSRLLDRCERTGAVAAFARQLPRPEAWSSVRRDHEQAFPSSDEAPDWLPLSLPMAVIERERLIERPFYTEAWASEDTEWGRWARSAGHRIEYVADARVMHSHNYTLRELAGRKFVEGEADGWMGGRCSVARVLGRTARETLRDCRGCLKERTLEQLPGSVARRCVANWFHARGCVWGRRRKQQSISDVASGQKFVLARHQR